MRLLCCNRCERKHQTANWYFAPSARPHSMSALYRPSLPQAGRKANIPFPVNPSMLRHSKGHQLAQQGYESETIQAYWPKNRARSRQYVQDGKAAAMSRNIALACSDDVSAATSKIWRQQLQQGKSLTLRVPLSSCNLGPGLDTIGFRP